MQPIDNRKQFTNDLLQKYGPLGPRHLLAAALLMQPRDTEKKAVSNDTKAPADKAAA